MAVKLTLVRGLPGSGKSTMANKIAITTCAKHVEADQFFVVDNKYKFDSSRIGQAHAWCLTETITALAKGLDVVVSNTFTRRWEMSAYIAAAEAIGCDYEILVASGNFGNVHNVPEEILSGMKALWEDWHQDHPICDE